LLLQSKDRFDQVALLDTSTGQISWLQKSEVYTEPPLPIKGHIAQLRGRTLCLYREAGSLYFKVDSEVFELTEDTEVEFVHMENDLNRITIFRKGVVLFTWTYERPIIHPPLKYDITPFVKEEDFDFCLFVSNVVSSSERRDRIYAVPLK
jgi:hypothetical protein